jgi:hypothetical protein
VRSKLNTAACSLSTPAVLGEEFLRDHPNFSARLDATWPPPSIFDPAERIEVGEELARLLNLEPIEGMPPLEHRIRVRRVAPCPDCQKPIVEVRFDHDGQRRICDAAQGAHGELWRANVLAEHDCGGSL